VLAEIEGRAAIRKLKSGSWLGWSEMPACASEWAASPVYVTTLKGAPGGVRLSFVHILHAVRPVRRRVELEILQNEDTHLVGRFRHADGSGRTALLAAPTIDWLQSWCPRLYRRFPAGNDSASDDPGRAYLDRVFGRSMNDLLGRPAPAPAGSARSLPERIERLPHRREFGAFDSWLLARGGQVWAAGREWRVNMEKDLIIIRDAADGGIEGLVWGAWRGDRYIADELVLNADPKAGGRSRSDPAHILAALEIIITGYPPER